MTSIRTFLILGCCVAAVCLAGCDQSGTKPSVTPTPPQPAAPEKTEVTVVNVEPVQETPAEPAPAPPKPNLLADYSLDAWVALPETLEFAPAGGEEDKPYEVAPYEGDDSPGEGAFGVTWSEADSNTATLFTDVKGLNTNTKYVLSLAAKNAKKSTGLVAVFGMEEGLEPERLLLQNIETDQEFEDLRFVFDAKSFERVRVMLSCPEAENKFPVEIAYANAKVSPLAFHLPPGWSSAWESAEAAPFTVEPVAGDTAESKALKQTWEKGDASTRVSNLLGMTVPGLEPNTNYVFSWRAASTGAKVHVAVFGVDPTDPDATPERLGLVDVNAGAESQSITFSTGNHDTVRIVFACPDDNTFPVEMTWKEVRLQEAD